MNIAIIAHDGKKELAAQFCTAYASILGRYELCATEMTGELLAKRTELPFRQLASATRSGMEQLIEQLERNRIDMMLFFADPDNAVYDKDVACLSALCSRINIPFAINSATAEVLLLSLSRGDLEWREAMKQDLS